MKHLLVILAKKKVILPLAILFAIFTFGLFPFYALQIQQLVGEVPKALDLYFSYDLSIVETLFAKLGEQGREEYRFFASRIDTMYPFIYGGLLCLLFVWLIKTISSTKSNWLYLSLLPLSISVFDVIENSNTVNMLDAYPTIESEFVQYASTISSIKHSLIVLSVITLLILIVLYMKRKRD